MERITRPAPEQTCPKCGQVLNHDASVNVSEDAENGQMERYSCPKHGTFTFIDGKLEKSTAGGISNP